MSPQTTRLYWVCALTVAPTERPPWCWERWADRLCVEYKLGGQDHREIARRKKAKAEKVVAAFDAVPRPKKTPQPAVLEQPVHRVRRAAIQPQAVQRELTATAA
jgi:hypothetical protein